MDEKLSELLALIMIFVALPLFIFSMFFVILSIFESFGIGF